MMLSVSYIVKIASLSALWGGGIQAASIKDARTASVLKPLTIDLSRDVPRMLNLIKNTVLPNQPEYLGLGSSAGIDLGVLKQLQKEWTTDFSWQAEETAMNKYHHFTAEIEGLTIHFIHHKSNDSNAIPLLLSHGWPGSFLEFLPLIEPLTMRATTSTGKTVSFDVVIPSLPGFAFSSPPPANWTVDDTARVFNTLMTEVLQYKSFAAHGTDWGAAPTYSLYDNFNTSTRAAHLAFLPFFPLLPAQLAAQNITLSELEQVEEQRFVDWYTSGDGYFREQTTKPNTLGLALIDNPMGQLAWIAEKFIDWSDPRAGTPPSLLTHNEILRSVSLYYLTRSFTSSIFTYFQNPNGFKSSYTKARTDAPLLFSTFKYNVGFWPKALVEQVGNLVMYRNHEFGGHFAGIDNPPALIDDLREIGSYWV